MVRELKRIDVTTIPELLRIAEEVHATGEPWVLRRDREDLAVVMPAKALKRRSMRGRPLTRNDSLFRLIGIGKSEIPGGVSGKKHDYFAEAYRQHLL